MQKWDGPVTVIVGRIEQAGGHPVEFAEVRYSGTPRTAEHHFVQIAVSRAGFDLGIGLVGEKECQIVVRQTRTRQEVLPFVGCPFPPEHPPKLDAYRVHLGSAPEREGLREASPPISSAPSLAAQPAVCWPYCS